MVAVVEQALGHVHGGDTGGLVLQAVEHELVLAQAVDGQFVDVFQRFLDVGGIECCQRTNHLDVLASERKDVGVGLQHHTEVAEEVAHAAERLLVVARLDMEGHAFFAVFTHDDTWSGEELLESFAHTHRSTAGATAAVRR